LQARTVAKENGRLAVLRTVLSQLAKKQPVTDQALAQAYEKATGQKPDSSEITRSVALLGGDAEVDTGEVRYRFVDLETEGAALDEEREQAKDEEKKLGRVVFASDN
jgi:hypothetical protein